MGSRAKTKSEEAARIRIEELESLVETNNAEANRSKQRISILTEALNTETAEKKEVEKRLRAPCKGCDESQHRLSDLADEVESLRAQLKDSDSRRRKEVEDALWLADSAEAKYTQLMSVLRQVLASNGGVEGASAAAAASLAAPTAPRHRKSKAKVCTPRPDAESCGPRAHSPLEPREATPPQSQGSCPSSSWNHGAAGFGRDADEAPNVMTSSSDAVGDSQHGKGASTPARADFSDEAQRLELEVVELCRVLGGRSP